MTLGILLFSCLSSRTNINFNPTNSMCLDATVANMHSAGCDVVSVEKTIYGVSKISCYEYNAENQSEWLSNDFYAIAFGSSIPEDARPICTDPFVIMTTSAPN